MAERRSRTARIAEGIEVREQILAGAESCFARYGIVKTTMDEIAKAAGVSRPLVYRHFDDRDNLILEVVLRHAHRLAADAHRHVARLTSFEDVLTEGLLYMTREVQKSEYLQFLFGAEHPETANRILGPSGAILDLAVEFWDPLVLAAQERGDVPSNLDRRQACHWIVLVALALLARPDFVPDSESQRELIHRFVLPAFAAAAVS